jgi:Fe-S cluster assembly protein SufD
MATATQQQLAARWSERIAAVAGPMPDPEWLKRLRGDAAQAFRAGGLPHRKVEAWKYTPLQILEDYDLAADVAEPSTLEAPPPLCERGPVIDIRDGRIAGALPALPEDASAMSLETGLERFGQRLRPLFESVDTAGPARAFAALNTALVQHGLVVHVAAGGDAGRVLLRWAGTREGSPVLDNFRLVVLLDEGARLDLVEQHQGPAEARGGLNLLCHVQLAGKAEFRHTRVQADAGETVLLSATQIEQATGSHYAYRGFDIGGRLSRHELTVRLLGTDATADVAGAFVLDGQRYGDHHVSVEHHAPGCRSEQFFRGVLGGRSRGVFNGRALIQPGADGSSVRQSNANLLLSPLAEMDTKPELEIYADEVEASHGATVGRLDENAVFYLRSRGLSDSDARRMLTAAFCRAVTERLEGRRLAERIAELLDAAMPDSEL